MFKIEKFFHLENGDESRRFLSKKLGISAKYRIFYLLPSWKSNRWIDSNRKLALELVWFVQRNVEVALFRVLMKERAQTRWFFQPTTVQIDCKR